MNPNEIETKLDEHWTPHLVRTWRRVTQTPGGDDLTDAEVARVGEAVEALSTGLTRARGLIGSPYMEGRDKLGAYLLYFWPRSYMQCARVLGSWSGPMGRVLDLGAGPGPMTMAAADLGAERVDAVERAGAAVRALSELGAHAPAQVHVARGDARDVTDAGGADLVILGHVVNELWSGRPERSDARAAWLEGLLDTVSPAGAVVIIEPALRETSRDLLEVRDLLVERGRGIAAPCLWRGACPALERERDWCHTEGSWRPGALVSRIAEVAGRKLERVKYSYLVVTPGQGGWRSGVAEEAWRVVSGPLHAKGRRTFIGCGPQGREHLTLLERHLGGERAVFDVLDRGDVIEVAGTMRKGDGLRLQPDAVVRRVHREGARWDDACDG